MGKRKEITGKDNGKQKMWTIITVIIVFFAMAGYAGMSYYYSDRFFKSSDFNISDLIKNNQGCRKKHFLLQTVS